MSDRTAYTWQQLVELAAAGHVVAVYPSKRVAAVDGFPRRPIAGRIPSNARDIILRTQPGTREY